MRAKIGQTCGTPRTRCSSTSTPCPRALAASRVESFAQDFVGAHEDQLRRQSREIGVERGMARITRIGIAEIVLRGLANALAVNMAQLRLLESTDPPVTAMSVQGENVMTAAGLGRPRLRASSAVLMASPPPAESPAMMKRRCGYVLTNHW